MNFHSSNYFEYMDKLQAMKSMQAFQLRSTQGEILDPSSTHAVAAPCTTLRKKNLLAELMNVSPGSLATSYEKFDGNTHSISRSKSLLNITREGARQAVVQLLRQHSSKSKVCVDGVLSHKEQAVPLGKSVLPGASGKIKVSKTSQVKSDIARDIQRSHREMKVLKQRGLKSYEKNDVLFGRGGRINVHQGNVIFRALINRYRKKYLFAKKNDKPFISRAVVKIIREIGGRFLKKDETSGLWFEVGDDHAREKTAQALRQQAPRIRRFLHNQVSISYTSKEKMECKTYELFLQGKGESRNAMRRFSKPRLSNPHIAIKEKLYQLQISSYMNSHGRSYCLPEDLLSNLGVAHPDN